MLLLKNIDEKLVIQIKNGNQKALESIMSLYLGSVYGVANSILIDVCPKEDIEECVQDVFIDSWNKIEKYDQDRGSFKTWLLIICKYKALNARKKFKKHSDIIDIENVKISTNVNIDDDIIKKENKEEFLKVIEAFKDIDREIFIRRYFLNQDIENLCNILNLSRTAIDNRLWRGRKKIKEIFEQRERRYINE
ncbi:MAG: RNA polymerase sigma-70 factor (ECF subfamily) [Clostridium sp.]